MPQVETTAGPVEASELGRTMGHDHVITGPEEARVQWPHAFDPDAELEACITAFRKLRALGVDTVCDPSVSGIGRNVHVNIAVTEATGVRFVMATGLYPAGMQFYWTRPEVLADYFVHDIEVGIQGTDVKAGFIKCVADAPGMVPAVVALHEKVAEASLRTGTPIMAHTNPRTGVGLEQMKLFTEAGIDPAMVHLAHVGNTDDLDAIERLLDTGCYIGLDQYGVGDREDLERRNATLLALLERGHGDRLILGHDASVVFDYVAPEYKRANMPNWHHAYLFEEGVPHLLDAGVGETQIDAMFGSNVHAWLAGTTADSVVARRSAVAG